MILELYNCAAFNILFLFLFLLNKFKMNIWDIILSFSVSELLMGEIDSSTLLSLPLTEKSRVSVCVCGCCWKCVWVASCKRSVSSAPLYILTVAQRRHTSVRNTSRMTHRSIFDMSRRTSHILFPEILLLHFRSPHLFQATNITHLTHSCKMHFDQS